MIKELGIEWTKQDFIQVACFLDQSGASYSFEWLNGPVLDGVFLDKPFD